MERMSCETKITNSESVDPGEDVQSPSDRFRALATSIRQHIQRWRMTLTHQAAAELAARDEAERAARVARLTRWTAGDLAAAAAQEAAARAQAEQLTRRTEFAGCNDHTMGIEHDVRNEHLASSFLWRLIAPTGLRRGWLYGR